MKTIKSKNVQNYVMDDMAWKVDLPRFFIMQFISCCGIQASEVVLIVSIRTVDSYVGKSTAGKNTGDQNWRNSYGTT